MSLKKFLCGALAASMIFSATVFAAPADSANAKLAKIEIDTYGAEQSGALLDRISRLEKSYSGENSSGNMNSRIDAIYSVLYENNTEPSILAKVNALEWNVNHEVQSGGMDKRLAALENQILGKVNEGTFNERIETLAKESFGDETLPIAQIPIPMNTLIKIATTAPVDSKDLKEGDTIPIKVVEDVFVDGDLVFASGLPGEGIVTAVRRAKGIFSNGKIEADFHTLKAIDGQDVKIFVGEESIDAMSSSSMARGLSLLGQTFSGKNKNLEEVFVRGKNVDLPAGVELYVQIKSPIVIYGVKLGKEATSGLSPDEMTAKPPVSPPVIVPIPVTKTPNVTEPPTVTEPTTPETETPPVTEPTTPDPSEPSDVDPHPDEGKTLEGYDGEIIEIVDED